MQLFSDDTYSGKASSYTNAGRRKNVKVPGFLGLQECYRCNTLDQDLRIKQAELLGRDIELHKERCLREASESSIMSLQIELLEKKTTELFFHDEDSEDGRINAEKKPGTELLKPSEKVECTRCNLLELKLHNKEVEFDAEKRLRDASDSCMQHLRKELLKKQSELKSFFIFEEEKPETEQLNEPEDTEIEKLKHEVELLKQSQRVLLSENLKLRQGVELRDKQYKELTDKHDADVAVLEDYRMWVQADKRKSSVKPVEIDPVEIDKAIAAGDVIGVGGFGTVYKATFMGESVAVKVLDENSFQGMREFDTEVRVLSRLSHKNIVRLVGYCKAKKALVYEYLENGSLDQRLSGKGHPKLSWKQRLGVAFDICSGLIFMHAIQLHPIVHCDLKPENIMFSSEDTPKLADFGISYQLTGVSGSGTCEHQSRGAPRGTAGYMDPVFLRTGNQRVSGDVYAFGIVLLQIVTGKDSMKLVEFVEEKLKDCKKLKGKSLNLQRRAMRVMDIVDQSMEDWDPETVIQLLELGVCCAQEDRLQRPSLSGIVWHKLFCARMKVDASTS